MMATLCMASLESDVVRPVMRAAAYGDQETSDELGNIFADWQPPFECFTCTQEFTEQQMFRAACRLPLRRHYARRQADVAQLSL
jgi:hypothetical protein